MCNMSTEMGAKTSYIQPDEVTMAYLAEHNITDYTIYETDPDYVYDADLTFDVTEIGPQLAAPFSVDNVDDLTAFAGLHVDQCYLGSCTGGRTEDFAVAAKILKGKHIAYGTRMILVPGSRFVLQECLEKGYIQTLMEAGAALTAPGCAACLGIHQGLLAEDEVCVSRRLSGHPSGTAGGRRGLRVFHQPQFPRPHGTCERTHLSGLTCQRRGCRAERKSNRPASVFGRR